MLCRADRNMDGDRQTCGSEGQSEADVSVPLGGKTLSKHSSASGTVLLSTSRVKRLQLCYLSQLQCSISSCSDQTANRVFESSCILFISKQNNKEWIDDNMKHVLRWKMSSIQQYLKSHHWKIIERHNGFLCSWAWCEQNDSLMMGSDLGIRMNEEKSQLCQLTSCQNSPSVLF